MVENGDAPKWETVGVAAAMLREHESDQAFLFDQFHGFLTAAMTEELTTIVSGGLLRKKQVTAFELSDGDWVYRLERSKSGRIVGSRKHVVRGITLKSEPIEVKEWIEGIAVILDERCRQSAETSKAVRELLGI
jgi:hypothetical protein